jgi:hypothetical protein
MIYRTNITRKIRTESEINNNTDMWILSMLFHLWHQYIVEFSLCNMKGDETWSSDQLLNPSVFTNIHLFPKKIKSFKKMINISSNIPSSDVNHIWTPTIYFEVNKMAKV